MVAAGVAECRVIADHLGQARDAAARVAAARVAADRVAADRAAVDRAAVGRVAVGQQGQACRAVADVAEFHVAAGRWGLAHVVADQQRATFPSVVGTVVQGQVASLKIEHHLPERPLHVVPVDHGLLAPSHESVEVHLQH